MGDDSGPQATLTEIYQLSKHVSGISPTFVMIDQVSGRTKTVILAHFVAQEGGQSYLHLGRISAQRAAGAFHALQNESFEIVVDKFPGSIVVCDYALLPGDWDGETGGAERAAVTVTKLPAKKDLDPSVPILLPLFPVFHKDQDAFKKKILESNANAKDCILLRWENGHEGTRADMVMSRRSSHASAMSSPWTQRVSARTP